MKKTLIVAGLISAAAVVTAVPAVADPTSTVSCSPAPMCLINGQMADWQGALTDFVTGQPKEWQGNVKDFFTNQPKEWQANVKDFYTNQPKEFAKNVATLGAYGAAKDAAENGG